MTKFKILKKFFDNDRREYNPGDTIELENEMKIHRMLCFGIIKPRKRPFERKPNVERAVVL